MNKRGLGGFALPTVLVASIIMMVVLLSAVSSTASVRSSIVEQYYSQLARSAADAGAAYAQACLEAGGVTWSDSSPLGPNTDCSGVQLAGFDCSITPTDPRCVVSINGNIVSTFSVMSPTLDPAGEITKISSKGTTSILRVSDNTPRTQYSYTSQVFITDHNLPDSSGSIRVLVVAGGGGGGSSAVSSGGGGGGGAGGLVYNPSMQIGVGSYNVVVGSGGSPGAAGSNAQGTNGGNSTFGTTTAIGGGGGGKTLANGSSGGSGGGAGFNNYATAYSGGIGTSGQGNNGGSTVNLAWAGGAGGGGAGGVGQSNSSTNHNGGVGGLGLGNSISGATVTYAAGGRGGGSVTAGAASPANSGKGGDGAYAAATAYAGGSGIVIISYPAASINATGGTITYSGGNAIHTFTSGTSSFVVNSIGGWKYKRPVTVSNPNTSALSNYQVKVTPFTDAGLLNNTGLVGSWHFNEDFGILNTTAFDMSGSGNHGAMSGVNFRADSSKFDTAFYGNGSDSNKVLVPYSPSINMTTALSIEAWVYPSGSATKEIITRMNTGGTVPVGYELFQNGQKISFRLYKTASPTTWTTNTTLTLNNWHHVVATWDGSTVKLYLDGVLDMAPTPSPAYTGSIDSSTTVGLAIGAYGNNTYLFNGKIDEVKLYNRALPGPATNCTADSANEVCRRYGPLGVPKIRSDYGDIRFTNVDGSTSYPYWQETDGTFWVKIPSLAVGNTTIYMYYGNSKAGSASSGDNTFAFFDDFTGNVINTAKWVELDTKASIAQSNGLVLTNITTAWDSALISKMKFNRVSGLTVSGRFVPTAIASPNHTMVGWSTDQEADPHYSKLIHAVYFNAGSLANAYELATPYLGVGSYTANSINLFESKLKTIGADYYNNGTAIYTGFGGGLSTATMRIAINQYNHVGTFNYIYVRQGSANEATASSPGAEVLQFNYSRI